MIVPKNAPKAVEIGVFLPVIGYSVIYITCVGVFSRMALMEITYPIVELATEVYIPGEFFERLCMFPKNISDFSKMGPVISYFVAKLRGVKSDVS
ncbi:hypothetical protein GCM10008018_18350 [Paenibacillus marchantiophytorum]|uniref:Uncharacterized protein n=1 Tax=Paenibacillus marchantiophytorum TaxID=1619310 RepID=A0ABQ2BSL2_9BACL|nr:hypothetical protein GCM10008018_18350 [Paenibacillus marchantiophytorum]